MTFLFNVEFKDGSFLNGVVSGIPYNKLKKITLFNIAFEGSDEERVLIYKPITEELVIDILYQAEDK